jgi:DHA1 family multidrug resistance protein-like MFS transporter
VVDWLWNRTFASTIYVLARDEVVAEFDVSTTVSLLPCSLYTLGIAFGPLTAAPFSETYGRRIVYLCSIPAFAAFIVGAGASQNTTSLLICRFFAGLFASPGLSIESGTIADI